MKKKGKIFILSGPSGAGKTTLYQKLLNDPKIKGKLKRSISVTTRDKRKGEKHGSDYLFISQKMFLYKKRSGHFLESMKVFDNYYGTPNKNVCDTLKIGKNILLAIDVQGTKEVLKKHADAVTIFVKTPTFKDLEKRLKKRASENKKVLDLRIKTAKKELKEAGKYKYIIVNDHVNKAFSKLKHIVLDKM
jgi:guanylate kinase